MKFLYGFRKYSILLIIIFLAVIFRILNYINGTEMVDLIKVSAVGFFGANLFSKFTKTLKGVKK